MSPILQRVRTEGFDMDRPVSDADGLSPRQRARLADVAPPRPVHRSPVKYRREQSPVNVVMDQDW